jgi:hypothetical protein
MFGPVANAGAAWAASKVIAVAAAAIFVIALGWWAHSSSLRGERDTALIAQGALKTALTTAGAANAEWESTALDAQAALAQCQSQWAEVTAEGMRLAAEAQAARDAARLQRQQWEERFRARGESCSVALAALDTACPELEGY